MDQQQFNTLLAREIEQMCRLALIEDLAGENNEDITAALIPAEKYASATLITREDCILCGVDWVNKVFELVDSQVTIDWQYQDGDKVAAGSILCKLKGNARALLTGERSAMNFLQTLSATATLTNQYVEQLGNSTCKLLDTRKTIPGMRFGQKYAVTCGGGSNHRLGLSDAYLIKENHIMSCGGIAQALATAINNNPEKLLEIEVESLDELVQALDGKAQVIMLDNFSLKDMKSATQLRDSHVNKAKLEASGNVSLETLAQIAETGVDYISVGALTKNVTALDLSMRIDLN
ncbi:carboxylating nicotinate-nucleotide diphosphorylase [Aliikangiella sp. G2MR2-5]|uniref:carboxylating nicotinate-nucleotide diphosphorylase n=1 Tax=Aliikangiella sp. G2MR2-5 TaxID=2788943 RepID=UPI00352D9514